MELITTLVNDARVFGRVFFWEVESLAFDLVSVYTRVLSAGLAFFDLPYLTTTYINIRNRVYLR